MSVSHDNPLLTDPIFKINLTIENDKYQSLKSLTL